ncbi:hypothetical protein TcasGA2_TC002579 [Tribolium castaneum]|uniref:Uncharacterized protein n=1 Tax=Tribolium castaneum TaxID=7070 RepID=D6WFL0_TRICA|nr:hypothetical protein TcasGA2_TC002579 [Tribolium castaneum]
MEQYYIAPWTILLLDTDLQLPYPCIYQKSSQENFTIMTERLPNIYIITLENRSLENSFDLFEEFEIFDPRAYFLIILTEPYNPYIFEILVDYYISKVVVLTLEDDLITYDPFIYEDVRANGIEPTNLGKCATFDVSSVNIFNKTLPFLWRNTTVLVTFVDHFPYINEGYDKWNHLWEEITGNYTTFNASGLFYFIFEIVAEKMQFETNLKAVESANNSAEDMLNSTDFELSVVQTYQMLFESAISILTTFRQNSIRMLTAFTLCGFLIISTLIKSELIDSFTTNAVKCPINSLQDIVENKLDCYISDEIMEFYDQFDNIYSDYTSNCSKLDENNDLVEQIVIGITTAFDKNRTFVTDSLKFRYISHLTEVAADNKLYLIKPHIKSDFLYAYFTKGYPLCNSFNKILQRMNSGGIIQFHRNLEAKTMELLTVRHREKLVSRDITFERILFAFYAWLLGIIVSIITFFIEIVKVSLFSLSIAIYATRHQLDLNLDPGGSNECVYKIMEQYYTAPWTILLLDTDMHFPYPCINLKTSQENFTKNIQRFADLYIITLENRSLGKILDLLEKFEIFDSRAYYLIILTEPYDPHIFEILVHYFIYKVVVLTLEEDLITYDPFIYEDLFANGIQPTDLGKCDNFNFSSVNIFNKRLPFSWRNTTVVATFVEHFPYLHKDYQSEFDNFWIESMNGSKLSGLFYYIFEIVAENIQFRTSLQAVAFTNNSAEEMLSTIYSKKYFKTLDQIYYSSKKDTHQLDLNLDTGGPNECVYKIMKQYYATPWTILLLDTDMHFPYPCIYLKTSQGNFTKIIHRLADFYIITLENRSLENILDLLEKFEIFDPRAYFLIILTEPYDPYIFEMLVYYFICKVVVLTLEDDLITYDPFIYEDVRANGIEPTDLGKCANFNFSSVNIFNKTLPFSWRNTTVVATFVEHFPYLHKDYQSEFDNFWIESMNGSTLSGLFYYIFEIVAENIQFQTSLLAVAFTNNSAEDMLSTIYSKKYFKTLDQIYYSSKKDT